jgi:hypothetical protein
MLIVSFTACYEQLPDPELLAQCLRDSFQEYLTLVQPPAKRKPKLAVVASGKRKTVATSTKAPRRKPAVRAVK